MLVHVSMCNEHHAFPFILHRPVQTWLTPAKSRCPGPFKSKSCWAETSLIKHLFLPLWPSISLSLSLSFSFSSDSVIP